MDYEDSRACRALTAVMLKHYLGIDYWNIPPGTLCPAVPQRVNYIKWVKELVPETHITVVDMYPINRGTGASLIYPILGVKLYGWKVYATEVDQESIRNCEKLVRENGLSDDVILVRSREGSVLRTLPESLTFHVSVCNPPFFPESCEFSPCQKPEINSNYEGKPNELRTPGGEEAFIKLYINESWEFRRRGKWFTSLVGVKAHLKTLGTYILSQFPGALKLEKTFKQGKTWRWGLAWRFQS